MAFNVNERIKEKPVEGNSDEILHGKVVGIDYVYRIRWDNGIEETDVDEEYIEAE